MNLTKIKTLLQGTGIDVTELIDNNKASEKYIRTTFIQDDGFSWKSVVPYEDRRAGLNLKSEEEVAEYLKSIKRYFTMDHMDQWRKKELSSGVIGGSVTPLFFKVLLSFKEEIDSFPPNDNPARRIQDIKDAGYTIASVPNAKDRKTSRIMLPLPRGEAMGYETFSPQFKARVIRVLRARNAYEARPTTPKGLIPDHKFSEVRWDADTKDENPMSMSDAEIKEKFQLLDNQRNQQKREVCRNCFQEGVRGTIYGIEYYYSGNNYWDPSIPKQGKEAEKGCVGCPWYDIERWREELMRQLKRETEDEWELFSK